MAACVLLTAFVLGIYSLENVEGSRIPSRIRRDNPVDKTAEERIAEELGISLSKVRISRIRREDHNANKTLEEQIADLKAKIEKLTEAVNKKSTNTTPDSQDGTTQSLPVTATTTTLNEIIGEMKQQLSRHELDLAHLTNTSQDLTNLYQELKKTLDQLLTNKSQAQHTPTTAGPSESNTKPIASTNPTSTTSSTTSSTTTTITTTTTTTTTKPLTASSSTKEKQTVSEATTMTRSPHAHQTVIIYILLSIIVLAVIFIMFQNRQKIKTLLCGKPEDDHRSDIKYEQLKKDDNKVMPKLEKSTKSSKYIY